MIRRPRLVICFLGLVATATLAAAPAEQAAAPASGKPTIVLVHGAFEDGSAWQRVIAGLQRKHHPDLQRFYAERMHAKTTPIKSSHAVIVSHAVEVARVIGEAARTARAVHNSRQ
jgi:hypothetical protein